MLRSSSSLLSVSNANSGKASQKEAKTVPQKKTPKKETTTTTTKSVEKLSNEENALIQAAERYHQQIKGKKIEPKSEKKVEATLNYQNSKTSEIQPGGTERDQNVNIYTGNPGIYQTEGDTLNFWSHSSLPVDTVPTAAILTEQPDKPYGFSGKQMKSEGQDWTFFLILIGWTVFASLQFGFSKYIVHVFQSIFNFSAAARLYREKGYSNNFGVFRLNVIFFLSLPFSIFLIARDNGMSGSSGIELYLIVFAAVNGYFMLKIFLYKILGSVFSQRETTGELVFNMMLYHNVLGLLLLPMATLHAWVPGFGTFSLFIVPGLIAIFYLMSIVRSIYFALREGISIFYLILYLCTLEILPILLVVKLATGA